MILMMASPRDTFTFRSTTSACTEKYSTSDSSVSLLFMMEIDAQTVAPSLLPTGSDKMVKTEL